VTDVGQLPPAGWYVDPGDAGQARYWDGGSWSEHVTLLPTAMPPRRSAPAPSAPRRSRRTLWFFTAVVVAGLLVGGSLALLSRHGTTPQTPRAVAAAYYQPVFQRLMGDITAVNDATTDSDFVQACTQLHTDLPAGRGLPSVTTGFDQLWATFLTDGSSFATSCLGGPASASGGAPAAYDRLTADATDVSTAFDKLPG
jgi:hypothetical protein